MSRAEWMTLRGLKTTTLEEELQRRSDLVAHAVATVGTDPELRHNTASDIRGSWTDFLEELSEAC